MAKLLYLEASPRHRESFSSRVAAAFLETYRETHPGDSIDHLHLFDDPLPEFDEAAAAAKMQQIAGLTQGKAGAPLAGKWADVVGQIERLKSADKVLLSSPMWNFSIPYRLKQYIDIIAQPGLTFYVNHEGQYVGMVKDRPLQMILASGSAYAHRYPRESDGTTTDFQQVYLEHIARFLGFQDIRVIRIEPTAAAPPAEVARMLAARTAEARAAGRVF